jgi:hypothetical protein
VSDEPPWEWVDGDRPSAMLFDVAYEGYLAAAGFFLFVYGLDFFDMATQLSGPAIPVWEAFPVLPLVFASLGIPLILLPRYVAILRRLGISPVGVRLKFPLRREFVPWPSVRSMGVDWITIERGSGYYVRYRLTENQARRLAHFVRPH